MTGQKMHKEKKVDTKKLAEQLERLPEEEKLKIYYMIKGIELMNDNQNEPVA